MIPPHAPAGEAERLLEPKAKAIADAISSRISQLGMKAVIGKRNACRYNDPGYSCWIKKHEKPDLGRIDWVVDVSIKDHGAGAFAIDASLEIRVLLYLVDNPESQREKRPKFTPPGDGRLAPATSDIELTQALTSTIGDSVNQLAQEVQQNVSAPSPVPSPVPAETRRSSRQRALDVAVEVRGTGQVSSRPNGILCGTNTTQSCAKDFLAADPSGAVEKQDKVTLTARPLGTAAVAHWSGSPCVNSILEHPLQCELAALSGDKGQQKVIVTFDRSRGRKAGAIALGVLSGLSLVSAGVLLGLSGRDAGGCTDGGQSYAQGCVYNLSGFALLSVGGAVLLGAGAAAAWWAPAPTSTQTIKREQ